MIHIDPKTEKLVQSSQGWRVEGEEKVITRFEGKKSERWVTWIRYISQKELLGK